MKQLTPALLLAALLGCDRTPEPAATPNSTPTPTLAAGNPADRAKEYLAEAEQAASRFTGEFRADALVRIAKARIAAGDTDGGLRLLESAKSATARVPSAFWRGLLTRDIIRIETAAGRFDDAEKTFKRLTVPGEDFLLTLQILCQGLAQQPVRVLTWIGDAKEEWGLSSNPQVEARLWMALARAELKSDDHEHGVESLQSASRATLRVSDASALAYLYFDLARLYTLAKKPSEATTALAQGLKATQTIPLDDFGTRAEVLAQGAVAQAESGAAADASKTFRDAVLASKSATNADRRSILLRDIARLQTGAGDATGAAETVGTLVGLVESAATRVGLAPGAAVQALADIGRFKEAKDMAQSIAGHRRGLAWADLAGAQAVAGHSIDAAASLKSAQQATSLANQNADRVAVLVAIGTAQIAMNDEAAAVATAQQIDSLDPYQGARLRIAAAESLVRPTKPPAP